MTRTEFDTPDDRIPPQCRPTVARVQFVLDGEQEAASLEDDTHLVACAACRERVAAAKLILSVLATPEPATMPTGLTERIVTAVKNDQATAVRGRSARIVIGVVAALAASLLLVAWLIQPTPGPDTPKNGQYDVAKTEPQPAPTVAPTPDSVPDPAPIRIRDELSKAGLALRETPKALTEPATAGSDVLVQLTSVLTSPMANVEPVNPMRDPEPAQSALAAIPGAARTSFEPVTGTARKAFNRLLSDVGAVSFKPKS